MSVAEITALKTINATIESLPVKDSKGVLKSNETSLLPNIIGIDYFESILEPAVTMEIQLWSTNSLFNLIPIRGGEKVTLELETARGTWEFDDDNPLYVYKVSDLSAEKLSETFTLHLVSREFLTNETNRCVRKYEKQNIHEHVKSILKDILLTDRYSDETIERTSNNYTFIGNYKKPFHTLQWLGPKSISATDSSTKGTSGDGPTGKANGTAGFLFYENKDGFNFKSIDGLTSSLKVAEGKSEMKESLKVGKAYSFSAIISESTTKGEPLKIIKWNIEKNIDLRKSLRIGMYSNYTFFYDMITNKVSGYKYNLKTELKGKNLGKDEIPVPGFGESISRTMFRMSDHGTLEKGAGLDTSGRDNADMAKSFSRYNLLFTQAINILVPLNTELKVGDVIYCEFPYKNQGGNSNEMDPEISGNYLIRELRHHFTANQNSTSLKLMRDSYGVYGPDN